MNIYGNKPGSPDVFGEVGRPAYVHVNLDAITNNMTYLRTRAHNPNIAVVGMVKGNAYGLGMVPVALHLKSLGVERLGVATTQEGCQLRRAGVKGPIHVCGNVQGWEVGECLRSNLIATLTTEESIKAMSQALHEEKTDHHTANGHIHSQEPKPGTVHIKIDSGMSRNGCQPEDLPHLIKLCEDLEVPLEGVYTHLADYENEEFTKDQMEAFYSAIQPYRNTGLLFHAANSGAILSGVGTELDMMRPGIAMYGLIHDPQTSFPDRGLRPAASVYGQASLVKRLPAGRRVGYGCTYRCDEDQWVVTIPVGYADCYWRHLSNRGVVIRVATGERCPVIGRVSMDAITVRVTPEPEPSAGESFLLMTADQDEETSAFGIADLVGTITYEVITRLQQRLPRYYTKDSHPHLITKPTD